MKLDAHLLQAALGCTPQQAAAFSEPLAAACAFYGIDTPARLAAFLAQIGHESGALRFTTEIWGPTPAQRRYEGRTDLGNTEPGDGERFKGHGLIQTTGRHNHARVRDRLRERFPHVPDFEAEPEALADPQWAALSATDYWGDRGLNALADRGDFVGITRKINGGTNGLADRIKRWDRAKAALGALIPVKPSTPQPGPESATAADPTPKEPNMPAPLIPILAAVLPSIIESIPKLGKLFSSGSEVSERNVKAAELAVGIVQEAVGARNAQEAAEVIAADPAMAQAARQAVESRWLEMVEAGGGGIDGARKADAAFVAGGSMPWHSPSFWAFALMLPLAYLIVGSVVGLWGSAWPGDVRAAIATAVVSLIVGGAAGYYWGATTSRNRSVTP
jgi:putative chitinase